MPRGRAPGARLFTVGVSVPSEFWVPCSQAKWWWWWGGVVQYRVGSARQEVEVAENALVSGACVGLGASVLTWDCATHLPNGFILREDEDTLPHVASISPSEWSSLASPGTLTTPSLCTQPVPILTIVPQALSFFRLP